MHRPLARFLNGHKDADISMTVANTKELLEKLDDGEIDFAILEGDYSKAAYEHIPFLVDHFIPICSPSIPWSVAQPPENKILPLSLASVS